MVRNAARGTKLKCQNEECALPFYDLNVVQPDCPNCGTAFDHEAAKERVNPSASYKRGRRQAPVFEIISPEAANERAAEEVDQDTQQGEGPVLDIDEDDSDHGDASGRSEKSPD